MGALNRRSAPTIIAATLLTGPLLVNSVLLVFAQQPRWGLALTIATGALAVLLLLHRVRLWQSVARRILHARPTVHCRLCGYACEGLDTRIIDSGTLAFEQSRCPECGRPNPR